MDRIIKPVLWTTRALKDLERVKQFNTRLYGFQKAKEIALKIQERAEILENSNYNFKEIGALDDDFIHLKRTYRKLIENYVKITYREGKTKVYIVRIFDTRQDPNKNK